MFGRATHGVLIAFGGYQTACPGTEIPGWSCDQRPFSEIFIYDIATSTWYHQTAAGQLPDLRAEFCAGVTAAPDDSSFQITIHGGWDQLKRRAFDGVYVLSVPSFRWIKVEDSGNPDLAGADQPGRRRHKCGMWNETSMIVTGGEITLGEWDTSFLTETCNPEYPPIKVLDTSTYTWQTEFNPSLTFSVPEVVTAVIGGVSSGGVSLTEPELGWESEDLAEIFGQTVIRDTYIPPGRLSQEDPPNSPVPSTTNDRSDLNKETPDKGQDTVNIGANAIAGIVVGAVVALACVSAAVFFYCWRRKSQVVDEATTPSTPSVPSITTIQRVKRWHKPELDATGVQRYELAVENHVYEMNGDNIARRKHMVYEKERGVWPGASAIHYA